MPLCRPPNRDTMCSSRGLLASDMKLPAKTPTSGGVEDVRPAQKRLSPKQLVGSQMIEL